MENNEIPPYDIPFNDDNSNGIDQELNNIENNEKVPDSLNDVVPNGNVDIESKSQEEVIEDTEEDTLATEIEDTPPSQSKKGVPIMGLIVLVLILMFVLIGALAYIYADTLNISFLSNNSGSPEAVKTMDLDDNLAEEMNSLSEDESLSMNQDVAVNGEDYEDTGISITRDRKNIRQNSNSLNDNEFNKVGREENYPPIPGSNNRNMQNEQMQRMRYYTSGTVGRIDPFNPKNNSGNELFEIIVPPVDPTPDTETQALMSLKITGIMYTPDSPSAIINIKGQDQLVRRGDKFDGFSVEKITKDKVTVKAGINVYTASVGEILNIEQVGVNSIPNLGKKFAGPYSKGKDKIIEINMID